MRTLRFEAERIRVEEAERRVEKAEAEMDAAEAELILAEKAHMAAQWDAGVCQRDDCERERGEHLPECWPHFRECGIEGCTGERDLRRSPSSPSGSCCPKHAAEVERRMRQAPVR